MATVEVKTTANKKAGSLDLDPSVFEAQVKPHLLHAEVRRQLAARRRGTHSTKNRSRVSGGGDKPYRQKGTGRARQGSIRSPQWEGGGVVFGPVPRSHSHSLNKKVRGAALRSALSQRMKEGALTVVDALELEEIKTRKLVDILDGLGLSGNRVLIVVNEPDDKVERSARNLSWANTLPAAGLNVYDVLHHAQLLMTKDAVSAVEARLRKESRS